MYKGHEGSVSLPQLHHIPLPQPPFDVELLEAEEAVFERRDALVERLYLLGGVAGLGHHLGGELLIEVVRRDVFADVLEEFEHGGLNDNANMLKKLRLFQKTGKNRSQIKWQ